MIEAPSAIESNDISLKSMVKILQGIEAALFDIVLWVVLLPKTLFKALFSPGWISPYVHGELSKESADRYDDYMSPVTLYVLSGIVPFFLVLRFAGNQEVEWVAKFNRLSLESQILVLTLVFVGAPLINSVLILLSKHQPIGRTSLRPVFHIQCVIYSVLYFLIVYTSFREKALGLKFSSHIILLIASLWVWYAETLILIEELKKTKVKSIFLAFAFLQISQVPLLITFLISEKGPFPAHQFF